MNRIVLYCSFFLLFLCGTDAAGQKSTLIVLPAGNGKYYTTDQPAKGSQTESSVSLRNLDIIYGESLPDRFISPGTPWFDRIIARLFSLLFSDGYGQMLEELFGLPYRENPIIND